MIAEDEILAIILALGDPDPDVRILVADAEEERTVRAQLSAAGVGPAGIAKVAFSRLDMN